MFDAVSEYERLKYLFEASRNEIIARQMSRYMRNRFSFYGLRAPRRHELTVSLLATLKMDESIKWTLIEKCYDDAYREMQYFAIDYLNVMMDFLGLNDLDKIKRLVEQKSWWDTVDALAAIVGRIMANSANRKNMMLSWSGADNLWVRRVAILHQLKYGKNADTELLGEIILRNLGSGEFFIDKAIAWSLREYSKTDLAWFTSFLDEYGEAMSSLTLRESRRYLIRTGNN